MRKILIIIDKKNWAFDTIAQNIIKYSKDNFEIYKKASKDKDFENFLKKNYKTFDLIHFMHWSLAARIVNPLKYFYLKSSKIEIKYKLILKKYNFLDYSKVITGVHGHHDFDGLKTTPEKNIKPGKNLIKFLNEFKMINCVSNKLYTLLKSSGVNKLAYTPNGIDIHKFKPKTKLFNTSKIVVGCSGTLARDEKEGISEFILPLKKIPWIELKVAVPQNDNYIKPDDMPDFLNKLDIYVMASKSEGFPLKLLEAAACGRLCVATKVGGSEDLIKDNITGYFFDRNKNDLLKIIENIKKNKLLERKKGLLMRKNIENNWSWKLRSKEWINFFLANIHS